ncbi:IS1634 family transposase [Actinomyces bowdenii]|uniref:IS1634 family transposase n=1 Tax=Actinomyces bowdenii TaxID=131109 RepID=A0A3P1UNX6_9ACTO|nr:IS1634 family transposase [Actinomyces bowdenii]RRD22816.1 IS1634 family transposase [Actinomyces bowdenii]
MSPFLRRVRTSSGATAVQIAVKEDGVRRIVEHLGSAHNKTELAALLEVGRQKIAAWQGQGLLDLESLEPAAGRTGLASTTVETKCSGLLWDVLHGACTRLGLRNATGGDRAFEQMVLARLIEPTSKAQVPRVLGDLGLESVSTRTLFRSLGRCVERGYREAISQALFDHVTASGGLALCLYDVTTLYFEAEKEDDLRKVGYSKDRRVDPQVIVGLLVDRAGFPLQVGCWEGNKAETTTIIPIVEAFQAAHGIEELVIVADAGMLSAANLAALDEAGVGFIVGARTTRAPGDLEAHFHWAGDAFTDGQVIDTITPRRGSRSERDKSRKSEPVWDPVTHPGSWRAVWVCSKRRAARDNQTLTAQANRARAVIAGEKRPKGTRFVTVHQGDQVLDEASIARARSLVGLKGYVTNIPSHLMDAGKVVSSYHELWHVEQSFRMSKHDLTARPVFHHTHDAIEAHLTVVMACLAVARYLQDTTGISIARIVRELHGLQEVTINLNGHQITAQPQLTQAAAEILKSLKPPGH